MGLIGSHCRSVEVNGGHLGVIGAELELVCVWGGGGGHWMSLELYVDQ